MINLANIVGRLVKEPNAYGEIAFITIATNESRKNKTTGEYTEEVQYHDCVLFGKTAKYALEHAKKGHLVCAVGKIQYKPRKGDDQYAKDMTIAANTFKILEKLEKKEPASNSYNSDQNDNAAQALPEDVPF